MQKEKVLMGMLVMVLAFGFVLGGCVSMTTQPYGEAGDNTLTLNLTEADGIGGLLYVTHVNGQPTGSGGVKYKIPMLLGEKVYINPVSVELTGKPIVFTVLCPVETRKNGQVMTVYKTTELTLSKLADLKGGDVVTLKYMYQTQTFAFIDATGNIVQQTIPSFK